MGGNCAVMKLVVVESVGARVDRALLKSVLGERGD